MQPFITNLPAKPQGREGATFSKAQRQGNGDQTTLCNRSGVRTQATLLKTYKRITSNNSYFCFLYILQLQLVRGTYYSLSLCPYGQNATPKDNGKFPLKLTVKSVLCLATEWWRWVYKYPRPLYLHSILWGFQVIFSQAGTNLWDWIFNQKLFSKTLAISN